MGLARGPKKKKEKEKKERRMGLGNQAGKRGYSQGWIERCFLHFIIMAEAGRWMSGRKMRGQAG